jgi:hypothetical protein
MTSVSNNETANASTNRAIRNTTLNLTSSSNSAQTSKRLVVKNLRGFFLNFLNFNLIFTITFSKSDSGITRRFVQ